MIRNLLGSNYYNPKPKRMYAIQTHRRATTLIAGSCVRASVRACVRDVFAIYDNNILPRLIMIIIKIIILYFIQIRHTDDFPSTGRAYPASVIKSC